MSEEKYMRSYLLATALISMVLVPALVHGIIENPDPIGYSVNQAKIKGNSISMPVTNTSTSPIEVQVVAHYDDGSQVHTASTIVSLAPKATGLARITVQTITDDIDPQNGIIDSAEPFGLGLALGAVLWSD